MTDFLEAALREMASSVPVALFCQSSSPHISQLPTAKHTGCDCHSWQNAADGGMMGSAGHWELHRQHQTPPSIHPFSVQAERRQHCFWGMKSDRFMVAFSKKRKGMSKSEVTHIGNMLTSTVAERAGKVNNTLCLCLSRFFPLFIATSSNNTLRKHSCDLR